MVSFFSSTYHFSISGKKCTFSSLSFSSSSLSSFSTSFGFLNSNASNECSFAPVFISYPKFKSRMNKISPNATINSGVLKENKEKSHIHSDKELNLVIVGGGAAGMFCAIHAKEICPQLNVIVLEKGKPLAKVKISGGGRCNVTTGLFSDPLPLSGQYPRGIRELKGSFFRLHGPIQTIDWFKSHGVDLKMELDGRMFPVSNSSSSIIDCLLNEARKLGVRIQTGRQVRSISVSTNQKFMIDIGNPSPLSSDFLLLATGSDRKGYDIAKSLNHTIIDPLPSLFTFKINDCDLNSLSGLSFSGVEAILEVFGSSPNLKAKFKQKGALLITHWGLSGPLVLQLSAWAARELHSSSYHAFLSIDFLPRLNFSQIENILLLHKQNNINKKINASFPSNFNFPKRFWIYFINKIGLSTESMWSDLNQKSVNRIVQNLKKFELTVDGKGEFKDEFVTSGGIPLNQINLKTMESKLIRNLYFAGEITNVDGLTGGFNFQNAWTGGYIAGVSIAQTANTVYGNDNNVLNLN